MKNEAESLVPSVLETLSCGSRPVWWVMQQIEASPGLVRRAIRLARERKLLKAKDDSSGPRQVREYLRRAH